MPVCMQLLFFLNHYFTTLSLFLQDHWPCFWHSPKWISKKITALLIVELLWFQLIRPKPTAVFLTIIAGKKVLTWRFVWNQSADSKSCPLPYCGKLTAKEHWQLGRPLPTITFRPPLFLLHLYHSLKPVSNKISRPRVVLASNYIYIKEKKTG